VDAKTLFETLYGILGRLVTPLAPTFVAIFYASGCSVVSSSSFIQQPTVNENGNEELTP